MKALLVSAVLFAIALPAISSELKKNKNGYWDVPWQILAEYDLKKKSLSKNLKKIINKNVSIDGFIIPLDYTQKSISEFLLVPFVPACMHVPPPPDNMIVNVKLDKKNAIKPGYYPFTVKGRLKIETSSKKVPNAEGAFMMNGIYSLSANSAREFKR